MTSLAFALPVVENSQWPLLLIGLCGCILVCLLLATAVRGLCILLGVVSAEPGKPVQPEPAIQTCPSELPASGPEQPGPSLLSPAEQRSMP